MTNAEWMRANPGMTVDTAIKEAEAWWVTHVTGRRRQDALPAERLAAWLFAEREEPADGPETTVVTTLTVTHIVRGITAEQTQERGLDKWIAENARTAALAGYREHVMATGQPDDVCVTAVQVFGIDRDESEAPA